MISKIKKPSNFVIIAILFLSACTTAVEITTPPEITAPSLPTATANVTDVAPVEEIVWETEMFFDQESLFSIVNPNVDGYMGRLVEDSQINFDRETRWDVSIKVAENSMSTGLIIEGETDFSTSEIFLGYSDRAWKIGYGDTGNYSFFKTLTVGGLEASLQLTISDDGKLLEVKNDNKMVFTTNFDAPIFRIGTEVNTYVMCGPQSSIEISSLSISRNESQPPFEAMAQPAPDYPLILAPVLPPVSSPITAQNASQLTRLVSLGEGDLINLQTSPDGKYVLVGTSNGILVLDSATLQKVSFLQSSMNPEEIYFFDDGRKVAALDRYHIRGHVWSFPDGEEIREVKLTCPLDPVRKDEWYYSWPSQNLEFTFAYYTGIAGLCRANDGEPVYLLEYQLNNGNFAVSADENLLAFSTADKLVLIQYHDGRVLAEIPAVGIKMIFFYPDGKTFAAVFANQTKFWNVVDYQLIDTLDGVGIANHERPSLFPFFSPDNSILVFRNENTYRLIRAIDREYINSVTGVGLEFTPDSQGFLVDSGTGQVNFYAVTEDRSGILLVNSVAGMGFNYGSEDHPGFLSEDKESLLVMKYWGQIGGWSQEIRIFELPSGERANFTFGRAGAPTDAVWIKGLRKFGVLFSTGIIEFHTLDAKSESMYRVIGEIPGADRTEIKFTSFSDKLVYARGDQVTIWDLKNNHYGYPKEGISAYSSFFIGNGKDVSPDGRYRISLSEKDNPGFRKSILVTINGVVMEDFSGYSHLEYAFSPDSKLLAISTFSIARMTNVSIYDLSTGKKVFFSGDYFSEGDYAPKIAFSPNGKYLAILSEAGYPQIWGIP